MFATQKKRAWRRPVRMIGILAAVASLLALASSVAPASADSHHRDRNAYLQTNLVSDQPGVAPVTDPNLVNPWGLASGPTSPLWVSDNGTDVATVYRGAVHGSPFAAAPLVVAIPGGAPTGQVFNGTSGFPLDVAGVKTPAVFLFASESGNITGWSPMLSPNTQAQTAVTTPGAIYKGLAIATTNKGTFLYAADFHNNRVDVFDSDFMPVQRPHAFQDSHLPNGFAPFNVQELNGRIYVTYAKQDANAEDDVKGLGNGFVDVYSPGGQLLHRLISRGRLDSPWGLAIAPDRFGRFSGALLVGNFGDGLIHAYDVHSGHFLGTLRDANHKPIEIDGLWGLRFGNGVAGGPTTLLFSAGPQDESHGLLGSIEVTE